MSNQSRQSSELLADYDHGQFFCELLGLNGLEHTAEVRRRLNQLDIKTLRRRAKRAEQELLNLGITFTVYTDRDAIDRILPFDVIPRILSREDWHTIDTGVQQRIAALNLFLDDIYHKEHILKDGVVPVDLVKGNENYRPEMKDFDLPHGTYIHICGTDIVRDDSGQFVVLEDNGRTPSGVSYVVENRHLMMRSFPDLADGIAIADVDQYGQRLMQTMTAVAPERHHRSGGGSAVSRHLQFGLLRTRVPGA